MKIVVTFGEDRQGTQGWFLGVGHVSYFLNWFVMFTL